MGAGLSALALLLATTPSAATARSGARSPYEVTPGGYREIPRFTVTYTGSGKYGTVYRANPPNPGGKPDTNGAKDSSTQRWALRFRRTVTIPPCGPVGSSAADPCEELQGPASAKGATTVTAKIDHTHVDGLYDELDRTVKCSLRYSTRKGKLLAAGIGLRYDARSRAILVTAYEPVYDALTNLSESCRQGDAIDRILDNYSTPGFSFADGYGPARWFTSRTVEIPARDFHRARLISLALRDTPAGAPPTKCAVPNPSYERCRTGGSWAGVLTFTASG